MQMFRRSSVLSGTIEREKELVLVGGGHSHVQLLRRFAMNPLVNTHLSVVLDIPVAVYSGMVPGFVAGQYEAGELEIDVVPLARRAQARVILSPAVGFEPEERRILLRDRPPIRYDVASIDIGATVMGLDLPGVKKYAVPTRPINQFVGRVADAVEQAGQRNRGRPYRVVIVGGGAGGVEVTFTLWQRLGGFEDPSLEVQLLQASPEILMGYPESLVNRIYRNAERRGIHIDCSRSVVEVEEKSLRLDDGEQIPYDLVVWVTGAMSHPVFQSSGLPTDDRGFVLTRSTLQVVGHDELFAVGDCASMKDYPHTPKAGVYAVRQGPYLIDNLRRVLSGRPLKRYRPQGSFLSLLNLGDGTAIGCKSGWSFEGRWVMSVKNWIDRHFISRFQVLDAKGSMTEEYKRLPDMLGEMKLLCGGCAAKVGQSVLERTLKRLGPSPPDDTVELGLDVPDDASAYQTPSGDLVVSSVDAFRAVFDDPYMVGRIAAVNAISDLEATGARPRYALALVAIPSDVLEEDAEELLYQVLSGARKVFDNTGVTVLGGHTTMGTELLVGFSIDGFARSRDELLTINRLNVGQKLVLTKPLGTGVVLHADMQGRARGPWLHAVIDSMIQSNRAPALVAREVGVRAVTDVTGFGLVGHLAEMLRASDLSGVINVAAIRGLPGSVELLSQGFRSTFHTENEKSKKGIVIDREAAEHPNFELLFDPQTSGGLVLGVDRRRVSEVLKKLKGAGVTDAAVVGEVTTRREDGALMEVVSRESFLQTIELHSLDSVSS